MRRQQKTPLWQKPTLSHQPHRSHSRLSTFTYLPFPKSVDIYDVKTEMEESHGKKPIQSRVQV